jgi:hypothetical protein
MNALSTQISPAASVTHIADAINQSLCKLQKQWAAVQSRPWWQAKDHRNVEQIAIACSDYLDDLEVLSKHNPGGPPFTLSDACLVKADQQNARIAALVRVTYHPYFMMHPEFLLKMADKFSLWKPLSEPVSVTWEQKASGGFRPITSYYLKRKAQSLMLRDLLQIAGIGGGHDFARKGCGGEKALVTQVTTLICEGYEWWWCTDIKSAYASIRRGHFGWLGLDRRLLMNIAFLPKCAKIEMTMPEDKEAFSKFMAELHPDLMDHVSLIDMAKLTVRRSLPQGSVLSPLLARALFAHLWAKAVPNNEAVMHSWQDDLNVGAETKVTLKAIKEHVTEVFASLSAGPIEFHDTPILPASSGKVSVLGYRLQPGRGYFLLPDGSREIHVKPGPKRIDKYKRRLTKRLADTPPDVDRQEVADTYHLHWFNSQMAWTKVPAYSFMVSQAKNDEYLYDFEHGQPMGGGFVKTNAK